GARRGSRGRAPCRGAPGPRAAWAANRTSGPGAARTRTGTLKRGERRSRGLQLLHFLGQLGDRFEEIRDEPVVGHLKDRGFLVLVDRDDDLRVLHAGEMLDGAGDADRYVERRRDHLAGLPDLEIVRHVAGIDRGPAGAHRRAQRVAQRLEVGGEVLAVLEPAAARTDDRRLADHRTIALGLADLDDLRLPVAR